MTLNTLELPLRGLARRLLLVGLAAAPAHVAAQTPQQPPPANAAPACAVSEDPAYAFSKEHPVEVGGGAMYVAARERRYLDALRGPSGQQVRYKRTGTVPKEPGPNPHTILDIYELTYDGLDKPAIIYLDAYHFDDALRAPTGFSCGAPIALSPPGPDAFRAMDDLRFIAYQQGASKDFTPIPLFPSGTSTRGVVLDQFRMIARGERAAALAGTRVAMTDDMLPPDVGRQPTVVVAYPIVCEGRSVAPQTIDLVGAQGAPVPRQGDYVRGESLAKLLGGLEVPPMSIAASFNLQHPRPNDVVRITYAEPCAGSSDVSLRMEYTPARLVTGPMPVLPAGAKPPAGPLRLQAQIDLDGVFQRPSYIGGPAELVPAAIEAIKTWTVEPARINGAPISTPVTLTITFRSPDRAPR